MNRSAIRSLASLAFAVAFVGASAQFLRAEPVNFQREVAPILVKRCLACHGELKFKGEFQLHTLEAMFKPGESGEQPVVTGKPEGSYLYKLLIEADADARMPKDADRLPVGEIDIIKRWISEGAKLEGVADKENLAKSTLVNLAQWKHADPPEAYSQPFPITALAIRPDGKDIAIGGLHEVTIFSAEDGILLRRIKGIAERTYALAFSKDGSKLVVAAGTPGRMGEVKLFGAADGAPLRHFGSFSDCAFTVAFSPDEKRLAVGGADSLVRLFDVATGKQELMLKDHSDWVTGVAWSPDGARLATASRDKTCKIFNAKTGELVTTFPEHGNYVWCIAYHPDGKHAISCGADEKIRYWLADDPPYEDPKKMEKKKRHQIGEIAGFASPVHRIVVADGKLFACAADKSVRQFDVEKRTPARQFSGHLDWPYALDYHGGTKRLVSAGFDGEVRIWQTDAKDEKQSLRSSFIAAPGLPATAKASPNPSK